MKNYLKLISVTLALLTLVFCFPLTALAAEAEADTTDCKIYTADEIMESLAITNAFSKSFVNAKDNDPSHIRITASNGGTNNFVRFDIGKTGGDGVYTPDFKFSDYPVAVVRYRTNVQTTNDLLAFNAGLLVKKTGAYERCWDLSTDLANNGQWRKAIIDLRTFNGYDNGAATVADIDPESGIKFLRMPLWAYSTGNYGGEYFDIAYIGFFKTVEDAENYNGRDSELTYSTVTFKSEDGTVISTIKNVLTGSTIDGANPPYISGKVFTGWADEEGKTVKPPFVLEKDLTLTAVYKASEKTVADSATTPFVIYDADYMNKNMRNTPDYTRWYKKAEGIEPAYMRIGSKTNNKDQFVRLDFHDINTAAAEIAPDFKVKDFPYLVIRYRTNMVTTDQSVPINAGLLVEKTGAYERCWGLTSEIINNGEWRKAIFDLSAFNGYYGGEATFDSIHPDSGVQYIRMPLWAYSAGNNITKEYFDIEYIGFFQNLDDAEIYGGRDVEIHKFSLSFLSEDGKSLGTAEYYSDSLVTFISAPAINEKIFVGWSDGETVHTTPFKITKNTVLTAVYKTDEEAVARNRREAEVSAEIAANRITTFLPFIKGYDGFEFRPDNNMTRAEACTVVTRLIVAEETLAQDTLHKSSFKDVDESAWYYKYIAYIDSNLGAFKVDSGNFYPDNKITRAEFVQLLYSMDWIKATDKKVSFKDVPENHVHFDAVMAAASAGIVNGKSADTFDPEGYIKRSEVVKVLCMVLGRNPDRDSFDRVALAGFADVNENHWAYPFVMASAYEHTAVKISSDKQVWLSVTDTNDYFSEAPAGIIDTFNADFDKRVEKILNSKSEWTVAPGGKVWYVSSEKGNNTNDGSASKPWKTLAKVMREQDNGLIKAGDVVLLERGGEWHEKFTCLEGVTYSAYGTGAKPRVLGSEEADNYRLWESTDVIGIYKYAYPVANNKDVGNIVFNNGEAYGMRVMKNSQNMTLKTGSDDLVGNGINTWLFPSRPFNDYKDLAKIAEDIPEADLMYYHDYDEKALYIYSRNGNPGRNFESVEICTYGNAVSAGSNVTIDNWCILYTGSHGIGAGSCENLTVRNCEIGWIGGSVQNPNTGNTGKYGNAVEIFGAADGFYVYNNYIYQCFDCGPTVQWQGTLADGEVMIEKNIEFYGNALCEAALEVWLSTTQAPSETSYALLENCRMYDNYVTGSGTGFKAYNHQKYEWCAFYGGVETTAKYVDCYIENNRFWNNRRHLLKAIPTTTKNGLGFEWRNNTIIHPVDEGSIGSLGDDSANAKGAATQYFYDKDTVNELVKNGTFGLNKFYYTSGDKANRRYFKDGTVTSFKG